MTHGLVNLYVLGSKVHVCDNLNEDILMMTCTTNNQNSIIFGCCKEICGDKCYSYKSPFSWSSSEGILNELLMMSICAFCSFIVLVLLESNISFRNCFSNAFGKFKTPIKKLNFFIEDLDVSLERNRIDQLVKTATDFDSINKDDSLVVQSLSKKYSNRTHAVKQISFGVQNQECFGFLGR